MGDVPSSLLGFKHNGMCDMGVNNDGDSKNREDNGDDADNDEL